MERASPMVDNVLSFKDGKSNKLDKDFYRAYNKAGRKTRNISQKDADDIGVRIESRPGSPLGRLVETKPGGLKRLSQYGQGHDMSQHGEGKPYGQ